MVAAVAIEEPQMAPKPAQATHRRHRQPAAQMADEGVGRAEQLLRHAGPRDQIAHQDEQRHHRERIVAPRLVDLGLDHREGGREVPVAQIGDAEEADHAHGDGDRDAQQRKHHHQAEADQSFRHVVVDLFGSKATRAARRSRENHLGQMHDAGDRHHDAP